MPDKVVVLMLVHPVIMGSVMSEITTGKVHVVEAKVQFAKDEAEHTTFLTPTEKTLPPTGLHVTGRDALVLESYAAMAYGMVAVPLVLSRLAEIEAGHFILGAVASTTTTYSPNGTTVRGWTWSGGGEHASHAR